MPSLASRVLGGVLGAADAETYADLERRIAERTRGVVTVATPHFGTPLAGFFTTVLGRQSPLGPDPG